MAIDISQGANAGDSSGNDDEAVMLDAKPRAIKDGSGETNLSSVEGSLVTREREIDLSQSSSKYDNDELQLLSPLLPSRKKQMTIQDKDSTPVGNSHGHASVQSRDLDTSKNSLTNYTYNLNQSPSSTNTLQSQPQPRMQQTGGPMQPHTPATNHGDQCRCHSIRSCQHGHQCRCRNIRSCH